MTENAKAWLMAHGAAEIDHPGGTLYAHLVRVYEQLGALGMSDDVQVAGLTHAVYGTDGFQRSLTTDRAEIRELVGEAAEALVYRYGACDRKLTWDDLAETRTVTDRFTGATERLDDDAVRDLVDLSIVNELDVFEQTGKYRDELGALFAAWAPVTSPSVVAEARRVLR